MTIATSDPGSWDRSALALATAAADEVEATLRVATALATAGRRIDLAGLDGEIGKLCAGLLDLPDEIGRTLRPRLIDLLGELDRLAATITPP